MDINKKTWFLIIIVILGFLNFLFYRPIARIIAKKVSEPVFWEKTKVEISPHNYVVHYERNKRIDLIFFSNDIKIFPTEDMLFIDRMNKDKAELIFSRINNLCINNDCDVHKGCKYDPKGINVNCVQIFGKLHDELEQPYHVYYYLNNSDILISYHGREDNHHVFDHELDQIFLIEKSRNNVSE